MRAELFYNPQLLIERLAEFSLEYRRLRKLRGTPSAELRNSTLDTLELLELLRPLDLRVIYDIGSNVGVWTLLAKSVHPYAVIHAFEPLEWHNREFSERTRSLSNVFLHNVALGPTHGQLEMHVPNRSDASSLLPMTVECQKEYALEPDRTVLVKVERLDDFVHNERLPSPDLIKLDIQGYELEALHGAKEVLANTSALLTEVSFIELYQGQCLFHDLTAFLAEREFLLFALSTKTHLGCPLLQADVLFVSQKVRSRLKSS